MERLKQHRQQEGLLYKPMLLFWFHLNLAAWVALKATEIRNSAPQGQHRGLPQLDLLTALPALQEGGFHGLGCWVCAVLRRSLCAV